MLRAEGLLCSFLGVTLDKSYFLSLLFSLYNGVTIVTVSQGYED